MSVPFSGVLSKGCGIAAALSKELRNLNLRPTRRIQIAFDPFAPGAINARDFLYYISSTKVGNTNPSCIIKTDILCDRQEPTVTFKLDPEYAQKIGSEIVTFKSGNLTCLEILRLYNKHLSALVPKEKPVEAVATKAEKKKKR